VASDIQTRLPLVTLETDRRITDDPRVRARVRVINHAPQRNTTQSEANIYDGRGAVEVRGRSSQRFPKKSYGLELRDASGDGRDSALLGMPSDDDWVLYAAYNDKALMRNVVAYQAARRLGRWAARTRFVELVLNDRYRGVYVLMERPELGNYRVDVPDRGLTGDYLLELTVGRQARDKGPYFRTPVKRRPIVYEDPEYRDLSRSERRYLRRTVGRAERALYYGWPGAWRRYLSLPAAVDYVLLQELFRNVDAFRRSTFLVKGAGAPLALGPVWDFDLAMGNSILGTSRHVTGWFTLTRDWAERLNADPKFRRALHRRWRTLRANGFRRHLLRTVDSAAAAVAPAVRRNFRRWPILHRRVWQNPAARGSFRAEVRYLRSWLSRRMDWMDRATR
jgi:hypothetical protein